MFDDWTTGGEKKMIIFKIEASEELREKIKQAV